MPTFERSHTLSLFRNPETGLGQSVPYVVPPALTLLKEETFETGTLASKTWINLNSGNENYAAIVNIGGNNYLRNNGYTANVTPDPLSGKTRNGLYTHTFLSSNYYSSTSGTNITFEQDFYFDDCWWKNKASSPDAYPIIAGKMFLSDTTVDHEACYLGLTDAGTLTLVSGNSGVADAVWAQPSNGGWGARAYGWRTATATPSNFIYFNTAATPLFRSDGVLRKLTFEIKYNPSGIGYHKGRFKVDGVVIFDESGRNTDVDGWFNLPIEYKFKGTRIFIGSVDNNTPLDYSTNPATYAGYASGYNVDRYAIYSGVIE